MATGSPKKQEKIENPEEWLLIVFAGALARPRPLLQGAIEARDG